MVVVEVLEGVDPLGELLQIQRQIVAGVELVAPSAVAAFDRAVELGRARRQDVERQLGVPTGEFELGHEFGAAVDLYRLWDRAFAPARGLRTRRRSWRWRAHKAQRPSIW